MLSISPRPQWGRDNMAAIFLTNENVQILITISLKGPINHIPALLQIMAWSRIGGKPLYEPMMISLLTYIYIWVTQSQWVKLRMGRGLRNFVVVQDTDPPYVAFLNQQYVEVVDWPAMSGIKYQSRPETWIILLIIWPNSVKLSVKRLEGEDIRFHGRYSGPETLILNSNFTMSRSPVNYFTIIKSIWNFVESTVALLSWFGSNVGAITQLKGFL